MRRLRIDVFRNEPGARMVATCSDVTAGGCKRVEKCWEFKPILLSMGLFSTFCVRGMQKPSPQVRERAFVTSSEDCDAQVFFSIGHALFSSGMKASAAGIVATRL